MILAVIARDMIALRVADAGGKRLSKVSAGIIELCRRDPSAVGLAALAWDYVEEALLVEAPAHTLPMPVDDSVLRALRDAVAEQFGCDLPDVVVALLEQHDGIARTELGTALFSATEMLESLWLREIDPCLMPISGDLAGNHAVLRLDPGASDHGAVYGFWHEDFADEGLEFMARNAAEYLMLARQHVIDTVTDMYRGPSPVT